MITPDVEDGVDNGNEMEESWMLTAGQASGLITLITSFQMEWRRLVDVDVEIDHSLIPAPKQTSVNVLC